MESKLSRDDERTGIQLQFDSVLAEYNVLRGQVGNYRQMQGQLDGLALTALGLSIPLILVILERSLDALGSVLLLPILFFAIAFTQLRHERQIQLDSIYVDTNLRPKANRLLSKLSSEEVSVFEWERYLAKHYFSPNLLVQWLVTTSRGGIGLGVGIGIIAVCLYLQFVLLELNWNAYETWLLLVALLIFAGDLVLGFYVARMHYRFYKEHS
jgi:hypothetical protein